MIGEGDSSVPLGHSWAQKLIILLHACFHSSSINTVSSGCPPSSPCSIAVALSPVLNPCFSDAINSLGCQLSREWEKSLEISEQFLPIQWSYVIWSTSKAEILMRIGVFFFLLWEANSIQYISQISQFSTEKSELCIAWSPSQFSPVLSQLVIRFSMHDVFSYGIILSYYD